MMIHVSGPTGCGKTTLMASLPSGATLIDLDMIDDRHAMFLLTQERYKKSVAAGGIDKFFKEKKRLNLIWLADTLGKNIPLVIFFGIANDSFGRLAADKKYTIKIDPATLYRQVNARTLSSITRHSDEIQQLLQTEHPELVKAVCVHKFKIRQEFIEPFYPATADLKKFYAMEKKRGYVAKTAKELHEILSKLIVKSRA